MNADFNPSPSPVSTPHCPLHGKPSLEPCVRCGTFRCDDCGPGGLCVACKQRGDNEAPYFSTSLWKMVVLHLATLGIYSVYWSYKQWKRVKDRGEDVWPIPRAIFLGFTSWSLFPKIAGEVSAAGLPVRFNAQAMAGVVLLTNLVVRLPDPFWLLNLFQIVPLILVQRDINELNERIAPNADKNSGLGAGGIVLIVLGAILWLLVLAGMVLPDDVGAGG